MKRIRPKAAGFPYGFTPVKGGRYKQGRRTISRGSHLRRTPGMSGMLGSPFFDSVGESAFFGSGRMGSTAVESIKRVGNVDNLIGAGAAVTALLGSSLLQGFMGKINVPMNIAMIAGPIGGAAIGSIVGNVVFKSEKAGDMAIGAALAHLAYGYIQAPIKKIFGMAGLGYVNALGQLFLPEDVQIAGGNMGQLYLPENVQVSGVSESYITEDDLIGEDESGDVW